MWVKFVRIYVLSIVVILQAQASSDLNDCQTALRQAGDFPIERYYPTPPSLFDFEGKLSIPHGSRAFQFWRRKTPPWIPDTAFAFHYLNPEQMRDLYLGGLRVVQVENPSRKIFSLSDGLTKLLKIRFKYQMGGRPKGFLNRLKSRFQIPKFTGTFRYLVFKKGLEYIFLTTLDYEHAQTIEYLEKKQSNLQYVAGGYLYVHGRLEVSLKGKKSYLELGISRPINHYRIKYDHLLNTKIEEKIIKSLKRQMTQVIRQNPAFDQDIIEFSKD